MFDKRTERERRKRLRWAAERDAEEVLGPEEERANFVFVEETTFGVSPSVNMVPMGPAANTQKAAKFDPAGVINDAFANVVDQLNKSLVPVKICLDAQQVLNDVQKAEIAALTERVQCLENAALGKPLEEIT